MNQKIYVTIQDLKKFKFSSTIKDYEKLPENPNYKFEKVIEIESMNGYDIYVYDEYTNSEIIQGGNIIKNEKKRFIRQASKTLKIIIYGAVTKVKVADGETSVLLNFSGTCFSKAH